MSPAIDAGDNAAIPVGFDFDYDGNPRIVGEIVDMGAYEWDGVSAVEETVGLPTAFTLHAAAPNPFNPQTTIAFENPRQEEVTLRIFDLSGRLVRELIAGEFRAPGRHEIVWNGRDDAGRQVASGTYFYRLEAGEFAETKRMVLVK